ncbi:hypothetical protein PR048_017754 [Dryococelus australis]|uniref:Uncharacterized protein n=1 Tax=Dryococelus australis TaxID=614101 RepID=A0ABQ9HAJ3_9NEOP|nr:hypothetical protein PR048_017754 [Dryococelus australis]
MNRRGKWWVEECTRALFKDIHVSWGFDSLGSGDVAVTPPSTDHPRCCLTTTIKIQPGRRRGSGRRHPPIHKCPRGVSFHLAAVEATERRSPCDVSTAFELDWTNICFSFEDVLPSFGVDGGCENFIINRLPGKLSDGAILGHKTTLLTCERRACQVKVPILWGVRAGWVAMAERLACSPPRPCHQIFACGNRAGRCHWSAGFLGDLPFPPPIHSGATPYSTGSQDLAGKGRPNLFTHSLTTLGVAYFYQSLQRTSS